MRSVVPVDRGRRAAARGRSRGGGDRLMRHIASRVWVPGDTKRHSGIGGRWGTSGSAAAACAARAPNTKHSVSELDASRFAPCTPAPPPVAGTVACASTGPWSVITPAHRSRSLHSAIACLAQRGTRLAGPPVRLRRPVARIDRWMSVIEMTPIGRRCVVEDCRTPDAGERRLLEQVRDVLVFSDQQRLLLGGPVADEHRGPLWWGCAAPTGRCSACRSLGRWRP